MSTSKIKNIGVVGAGQMGSGIAQVAACQGLNITLFDISPDQTRKAETSILKSAEKLLSKAKLSQDQYEQVKSINYSNSLTELTEMDLVIEAIVENESIKTQLFRQLDEILKASAIIATNTSSISITRLAASTQRADRFIGMHFMNPVPIMQLVEIIPGIATSADTTEAISTLAKDLGKTVTTSKDYPGFVVNRILMPMINEAFTALMEGVASAQDIDAGMKLGTNQPMGPLALADFIGLDTCLAIMRVLHDGLGDSKYRPSPLLVQYVDAGWYGRKSGRGVYSY